MTIELHLGDCLEILPALEAGSVGLVVTDVPYSLDKTGISFDGDYVEKMTAIFDQVYRVMTDGAPAFIVCAPPHVFVYRDILEHGGLEYKGLHAWCSRASFYPSSFWNPSWEPIFCMAKGKAHRLNKIAKRFLIGNGVDLDGYNYNDSSVFPRPRNGRHPAEKPLALMLKYIIATTDQGDTVLDPFMGSGTTGVACAQMNRNFIGIEKDQEYFNIASKRISTAQMRLPI